MLILSGGHKMLTFSQDYPFFKDGHTILVIIAVVYLSLRVISTLCTVFVSMSFFSCFFLGLKMTIFLSVSDKIYRSLKTLNLFLKRVLTRFYSTHFSNQVHAGHICRITTELKNVTHKHNYRIYYKRLAKWPVKIS